MSEIPLAASIFGRNSHYGTIQTNPPDTGVIDMEAISTRTGLQIGGRRKAIKLASADDFFAACEVLEHLRENHVIEYDVISGSDVIVLPARVLNLAVPLLSKTGVKFWEIKVVPLNQLKPEQQAERRALSRSKRIA